MSNLQLVEAIKSGDSSKAEELIRAGADVNQQDDQGWTPLNFAAGTGNLGIVKLLVEKGASVFTVGRDLRTPYLIALAAGHVEVVKYLREVEEEAPHNSTRRERKYCKAYYVRDLRKFPGWSESRIRWNERRDKDAADQSDQGLTDDSIVYLHEDFSVTQSMWHNESIIFDQIDDDWKKFCSETLHFKVPDDTDLIAATQTV